MPLKMFTSKNENPPPKIKYVLGIAAGKGGVGKSSITVNLAFALQKAGYSVGIMDTDIYGPSIRKMLPEDRLPTQKGEYLVPALCQGIKMISMAYFRKENEAAVIRAPIANGIITQFIKNVDWGNLDFLLIDFPPGTGDVQLTLSQQANLTAAILVTTPQEVALLDVRKAMHMFQQVKIPILGIVENMSYYISGNSKEKVYIFGKEGGLRLSQEAGVPLLGQIPLDEMICQSGDKGYSLFQKDPKEETPAVVALTNFSKEVAQQVKLLKEESSHCLEFFELNWKEMN